MFKGNKVNKQLDHAQMLSGDSPIFNQFGKNVYASDIVQMCIDVIATECSKLKPKHIRTDDKGMQTTVKSSMNRLFKFSPNELMTTRDFIEKIIWMLYLNLNAFIYPMYTVKRNSLGKRVKEYTGFYPLNPSIVTFLQNKKGKLFLEMEFMNGEIYTIPYSSIIHLRKRFSVNDVMGGGVNGQPDDEALLKVLNINDTLMQGLEKGIQTSMQVRGIIKKNTMLDDGSIDKEREKFEDKIANNKSGILVTDLKSDYIDIKPNPKMIDKETLDFLQSKVLNHYGVSVPILTGEFSDEDYQAFYEKTLETIVISLGQAFSKTIFSDEELENGDEIVFYQKDMMYLSTSAKLDVLKTAGEQGLLTDNQKLGILGYSPIQGGDRRTMSLNYINVDLIDSYQMSRSSNTGGGSSQNE